MPESQIEFAVQMTCDSCVEAVKKSLENDPNITNVKIDLEKNSVVVSTSLPTLQIQEKLEKTGKKVVVRGYAGSSAGVAILDTGKNTIQGVVRFVQVSPNSCIIDGTVDGLEAGIDHKLTIHECGDLSGGCETVGDIFQPIETKNHQVYGDLGLINVAQDGRAIFKKENTTIKLSDLIGRSLVVSNTNQKLVCGIIARSAGLFENPKTICACDGLTIWNEKIPPKSVL